MVQLPPSTTRPRGSAVAPPSAGLTSSVMRNPLQITPRPHGTFHKAVTAVRRNYLMGPASHSGDRRPMPHTAMGGGPGQQDQPYTPAALFFVTLLTTAAVASSALRPQATHLP